MRRGALRTRGSLDPEARGALAGASQDSLPDARDSGCIRAPACACRLARALPDRDTGSHRCSAHGERRVSAEHRQLPERVRARGGNFRALRRAGLPGHLRMDLRQRERDHHAHRLLRRRPHRKRWKPGERCRLPQPGGPRGGHLRPLWRARQPRLLRVGLRQRERDHRAHRLLRRRAHRRRWKPVQLREPPERDGPRGRGDPSASRAGATRDSPHGSTTARAGPPRASGSSTPRTPGAMARSSAPRTS